MNHEGILVHAVFIIFSVVSCAFHNHELRLKIYITIKIYLNQFHKIYITIIVSEIISVSCKQISCRM
jgi:hypothetical protein